MFRSPDAWVVGYHDGMKSGFELGWQLANTVSADAMEIEIPPGHALAGKWVIAVAGERLLVPVRRREAC